MKYMLDTNICIYIIKEKPPEVLEKFDSLQVGDVAISSVTLSELAYGVEKSLHPKKNGEALREFLLPLEIPSYDEAASYHYGAIRAFLEKKGQPIGALDLMIAAHARSLGFKLVTNNITEFSRVPQLKVENWVK